MHVIETKHAKWVEVGRGAQMVISNGDLEWLLRYADIRDIRDIQCVVAAVLQSYDYLLSPTTSMKEATRRLRLLREVKRDSHTQA